MEYIKVTKDNIEKEHICCAISNNKDIQVSSKKAWLFDRFDDGLMFLKSVERGKCFIEYIPAENAWNPIDAEGYMYIDCLWVSGAFKGHGYANDLLEANNGIQLWYLSFFSDVEKPKFRKCAKHPHVNESGYVLYYTNQCPFTAKYVSLVEKTAKENNIPFSVIHITSREQARNVPLPITTYALFYDGEYLTNEIMNEKKFLKLIND